MLDQDNTEDNKTIHHKRILSKIGKQVVKDHLYQVLVVINGIKIDIHPINKDLINNILR